MSAARCRGGALSFGTIDGEVDSKLFFLPLPLLTVRVWAPTQVRCHSGKKKKSLKRLYSSDAKLIGLCL